MYVLEKYIHMFFFRIRWIILVRRCTRTIATLVIPHEVCIWEIGKFMSKYVFNGCEQLRPEVVWCVNPLTNTISLLYGGPESFSSSLSPIAWKQFSVSPHFLTSYFRPDSLPRHCPIPLPHCGHLGAEKPFGQAFCHLPSPWWGPFNASYSHLTRHSSL